MRLLLDTHVVLWWLTGAPELPADVSEMLDHEPDVYLSAASVWEVGIKQAVGKLDGPADLTDLLRAAGFVPLAIDATHAAAVARLPLIHRDPFDRILVAQARCEELTLVTRDPWCRKYEVELFAL